MHFLLHVQISLSEKCKNDQQTVIVHYCVSGMDFKKSIPRSFLELVSAARAWQSDSQPQADEELEVLRYLDDLQGCKKVSLALIGVQEV